jgi:predicted phage tail protein
MGLAAGVTFYYRAQLVDKTGNESGYTDWVEGSSSSDASAILAAIGADIMTTEAGQELVSQIDTNTDALVATALANHANVLQQWANYGSNRAGIISINTTIANDQQSLAEYQQDVTARFQNNESTIQTTETALADLSGDVSAQYSVKLGVTSDGHYYAAGMGIGIQNTPEGMQSEVLFLADRFAFLNETNNVISTPFAIQGGQTFINSAFIEDASITNEKIGNYIQSANYVAGSAGWYIGKDGTAEFNNVTVRGTVYATDGDFSGTVYANKIDGEIVNGFVLNTIAVDESNSDYSYTNNYIITVNQNYSYPMVASISIPITITQVSNYSGVTGTTLQFKILDTNGNTVSSLSVFADNTANVFPMYNTLTVGIPLAQGVASQSFQMQISHNLHGFIKYTIQGAVVMVMRKLGSITASW